MKVKTLGNDCQLCHILLTAARVRTYEVRNNLLTQILLGIYLVKDALELLKQFK